MELAILATSVDATGPVSEPENADILSRLAAEQLLGKKMELNSSLQRATKYAEQAVDDFISLETAPSSEKGSTTAYPSLHFQASFLAARLNLRFEELAAQIDRLEALLGSTSGNANVSGRVSDAMGDDSSQSDFQKRAIYLLEDAVYQAETPATSTTHMRAERAKFFTRYAPAYDLLVDLYVNRAVGNATQANVASESPAFVQLCKAIEVAEKARNRTFREQIASWQTPDHKPSSFQWSDIAKLSTPGTALLIYHLGGPHLIEGSRAADSSSLSSRGSGHLFVVLNGGSEIRYYRLLDSVSASRDQSRPLTRDAAAEYVVHQIDWITDREGHAKWGRRSQRELTSTLLPGDLLSLLSNSSDSLATATAPTPKAIRRIVIVPDGALHQLPFESLLAPIAPGEESIQYLLDILPPIAYGPSLSVLKTLTDHRSQSNHAALTLLTVGNPSYPPVDRQRDVPAWRQLLDHLESTPGFSALAHSQRECEAVYADYAALPSTHRIKLLQADATEQEVREYIEKSRVVHIAAHGCVNHVDDNLYGALVLTRPERVTDSADDGLLQLREIYTLDLSHCDLAVLSACQTNVGADRPLEAGMSMARAFLEQGTRCVVCSQWSVDDEATATLMKEFFARASQGSESSAGTDLASALWSAKRSIRRTEAWKESPKFWSAFVLVGL